ncbi:hypothetical protein H5410_064659 [Solanum commersonii]|uniref:Uncharacterized protein n=1 Tax=Solanum commersonii TaxID=4109 RepID=A0A9J5VYT1_SOLCO|nr:hypothetical protein H5410_064659 [Solanum commersonii]
MIIPEKIEKQEEIQKIEIPAFYARKRRKYNIELLCQRTYDDLFKLQRNQTSRYGRNKTMDIKPTKTRTKTNNKSYKIKLYFNRDNVQLLQNYRTQISGSPMFKMLWRRQYNSSCQSGIEIGRQDNSKTKAKIMEGKDNKIMEEDSGRR